MASYPPYWMINIGIIMETVVISTSGGQGASTCGRADVNRKKGRMVVPKTGHLSSAYHCNCNVMVSDDGDDYGDDYDYDQ